MAITKISSVGLALIKEFEGLRLKAYQCSAGVWTIGYGHTSGVKEGDTCTNSQAEKWLESDVSTAEKAVASYNSIYSWNQNEFDALTSFTFNCGSGNLKKLLNSGSRDRSGIAASLPLYRNANGVVVAGLVRRRAAELELFLKDSDTVSDSSAGESTDCEAVDMNSVAYGQTFCNSKYGLNLAVDGSYGPDSKKGATKGLQTEYNVQYKTNLAVDGSYGTKTQAVTKKYNLKKGASGNITRLMQFALIGKGYSVGSTGIDGSFGTDTESGLKKFQKANGLTADGVAGSNSWKKLLS